MARAPKTTPGTEVANWDEELAKAAEVAAGMEASSGGGQFFSMKGGQLSFNGAPMPGNQMAVIVIDSIFENIFYAEAYNPDSPAPPTCFAFGRDDDMAPHESVFKAEQAQNEQCKGCPMNEWGSSDKGRGKACRNTRRLGLIPAGTFNQQGKFEPIEDVDHYLSATVAYMKLPVTSIKGYAAYVQQAAGVMRRPPHGLFTKISTVPDPKNQFAVKFEPLANVPNSLMAAVMKRNAEVKSLIEFPYNLEVQAAPAAPARGRAAPAGKKPPVRKGKY